MEEKKNRVRRTGEWKKGWILVEWNKRWRKCRVGGIKGGAKVGDERKQGFRVRVW